MSYERGSRELPRFAAANLEQISSESGEIRTLTARGKSPARFLYATDSLLAGPLFDYRYRL